MRMEGNDFETIFERLCSALKDQGKVEKITSEFKILKTDFERIDYLMKLDPVLKIVKLSEELLCDGKSFSRSQQLRNDGNLYFRKKSFDLALQKYTESVASSPWPSTGQDENLRSSLALAFANRSAVLVHIDQHQLAVDDIDHALKHGYPKELAYKLHERKARCLVSLGYPAEAVVSFEAAKATLQESQLDDQKKKQWIDDVCKETEKCNNFQPSANAVSSVSDSVTTYDRSLPNVANGLNSKFCSLSEACNVKYEPNKGRFIFAVQDITPGEVLLIEKPYASVLLAEHYMDHCYHCFKRTLAPVPCSACCTALYCSFNCQMLSQNTYHRFECQSINALKAAQVDKFAYLALRTLAITSLPSLLRYRRQVELGRYSAMDTVSLGSNQSGLYTSDEYHAICSLVTHANERNVHDLFRRSVIAIFLLQCLQHCGYFEHSLGEEVSPDIQSYVGGMLLSHLQSFPCNAHEISEFSLDIDAVAESTPHELGAGIYATLSLFNHSCDPSVTRNFYSDTCVVRTIKGVKSGCEISDNYGAVFAIHSRDERQKKLQPQYFFDCTCEACTNNWPMFSQIVNPMPPRWCCCSCNLPLPSSHSVAGISDGLVPCSNCGFEQNLPLKLKELVKSEKSYRLAFDELLKCQVDIALPILLNHLKVMDRLLCLPWKDYSCCQEAVKQCFSIMANCVVINKSTLKTL